MKHSVLRHGERIRLQPVAERDIAHLVQWRRNSDISPRLHFVSSEADRSETTIFKIIEQSKDQLMLSIVSKQSENIIGFASLYDIDWTQKTCKLGVIIGEMQHWGNGFGAECLEILLRLGFEKLNFFAIACHVIASNERATAALRNRGFTEVGKMPNWVLQKDNTRTDEIVFVLDAVKWASKN